MSNWKGFKTTQTRRNWHHKKVKLSNYFWLSHDLDVRSFSSAIHCCAISLWYISCYVDRLRVLACGWKIFFKSLSQILCEVDKTCVFWHIFFSVTFSSGSTLKQVLQWLLMSSPVDTYVGVKVYTKLVQHGWWISPFANSDYDVLCLKSRRSPEDKLEEANVHLQCGELHRFNKNVFYLSFVDCLILIPTLYHCTRIWRNSWMN